jgi:hypothetical protein
MNTFTELVGSHALRDTLGVSGIPAPVFRSVARALKVVLASDGAIHPAEMNEYLEVCRRYGATEAMLEELDYRPVYSFPFLQTQVRPTAR